MSYGMLAIIVILIAAVLGMIIMAWNYTRKSKQRSAARQAKTQPVVQSLYSSDLMKRALITRLNDGRFKVLSQHYSEKIIDVRGEVAGWQSQPKQPILETLAGAVEIAEDWVHADD